MNLNIHSELPESKDWRIGCVGSGFIMSDCHLVAYGKAGFNPYRVSQLSYNDAWKTGGMSEKAAGYYLGAIRASLDSPNMILDLRIPQNQKYQQVVLDEAMSQ